MKKQLLKYLLAMFMFVGVASAGYAQTRVYVKVQPKAVVVARPAAPHPHYVWIDNEWAAKNGAYVSVAGYWAAPRAGFVWVPGHWVSEPKGYYWMPGHWRKL